VDISSKKGCDIFSISSSAISILAQVCSKFSSDGGSKKTSSWKVSVTTDLHIFQYSSENIVEEYFINFP